MKHIETIQKPCLKNSLAHGGCGECQASCQSACKTSCTVANQSCANKENNDTKVRRFISQKGIYSKEIQQEGILYKAKKYQRSWQGSRTLLLGEISCKERTILHSGYW